MAAVRVRDPEGKAKRKGKGKRESVCVCVCRLRASRLIDACWTILRDESDVMKRDKALEGGGKRKRKPGPGGTW